MRTTKEIEDFLPRLNQIIGFTNEPKWITLRFMINISLSFKKDKEFDTNVEFDGKTYNLEQVTGEGKEQEDYTDLYWNMFEAFEDIKIANKKDFVHKLEWHLVRGYRLLSTSVKNNSNIYEFLTQEF